MAFYMKIVPTGDEMVLLEMSAPDGKATEQLTARVWRGITQSGHEIEVAVVKILKIDELDERILTDHCRELAEEASSSPTRDMIHGMPPGRPV